MRFVVLKSRSPLWGLLAQGPECSRCRELEWVRVAGLQLLLPWTLVWQLFVSHLMSFSGGGKQQQSVSFRRETGREFIHWSHYFNCSLFKTCKTSGAIKEANRSLEAEWDGEGKKENMSLYIIQPESKEALRTHQVSKCCERKRAFRSLGILVPILFPFSSLCLP